MTSSPPVEHTEEDMNTAIEDPDPDQIAGSDPSDD